MGEILRSLDQFRAGSEHSIATNAALVGASVVGEYVVIEQAPEYAEFGYIAAVLVAVPAVGRIIDTLKGRNQENTSP